MGVGPGEASRVRDRCRGSERAEAAVGVCVGAEVKRGYHGQRAEDLAGPLVPECVWREPTPHPGRRG